MEKTAILKKLDMMRNIIAIAERADKAKNVEKFDLAMRVLLDAVDELRAENKVQKLDLDK